MKAGVEKKDKIKVSATRNEPASSIDSSEVGGSLPIESSSLSLTIVAILGTLFALQWAQKFFIPLFIGMVIAYTLNPLVVWLQRVHVPRVVGTVLVMVALLCAGAFAMMSLRGEVERIVEQVPEAASKLSAALREMAGQPNTMQKVQAAAREIEQATSDATESSPTSQKRATRVVVEQPSFKIVDFLWTGSMGIFGIIGDMVVLLFLIFFLLLSGDTFKRKLLRVSGPSLSRKKITMSILDDINTAIQSYMFTMLVANVVLGFLTWGAFRWIGLENAGAWAMAAGVLHIVPYLGPALTAVATGVAGFMQFGSIGMAILIAGSSLVIATFVGLILVTWMSGKLSKMNAAAVFISLVFWGWLWGMWGLLLAIPIMGILKVIFQHVEGLQPFAELLEE